MTKDMLSKSYCKKIAKDYVASTGLSQTRIAKEIFAHAILYLGGRVAQTNSVIGSIPMAQQTITYILKHSNPVNLGGDAWYRVAAYNAIWIGIPSLRRFRDEESKLLKLCWNLLFISNAYSISNAD